MVSSGGRGPTGSGASGWQAHVGGLADGVAGGWIFRERRPKVPAKPTPVTGSAAGLNCPGTQPGRSAP